MPLSAILIWAGFAAILIYLFVKKKQGQKKYEGVDMSIDEGWFEDSQAMYGDDIQKKAYYFQYDKNFSSVGHYMVDQDKNVVYEAKFLYNNVLGEDEVDFVNHIIDFKHHHKVGHTVTSHIGLGSSSATIDSTFKFDGTDVYSYIEEKGYEYRFNLLGLAYTFDLLKNGEVVGTIYSSNTGKNYFGCSAPYQAKMGANGLYIVEAADKDIDAAFLLAMAVTRTDLSLKHSK